MKNVIINTKLKKNHKSETVTKNLESPHGITIITLVITIVILIILAGIIINMSIGENGIFTKAKQAKEKTNLEVAREKIDLKIVNAQLDMYEKEQRMPTLKELSLTLNDDDEIEYITETTQVVNKKYEVGEEPTLIYTKLKEYPYEFEINSLLKIGSIDETKVEKNNKGKLKKVVLGTYETRESITFDVSMYPEYENFTEDNFACSPIKAIYGSSKSSTEYYGTIEYNNITGIVTFPAGYRTMDNMKYVKYDVYLYYIEE